MYNCRQVVGLVNRTLVSGNALRKEGTKVLFTSKKQCLGFTLNSK